MRVRSQLLRRSQIYPNVRIQLQPYRYMKQTILLLALWSTLLLQATTTDYTQYVNPFIGTQTDATGALSGSTFPGATMPQGIVQVSPDTEQMVTWDPCSGYDYNRDSIYAISHTHLSGTGCTDLFDVSLMPVAWNVTPEYLATGNFGQTFSHEQEAASPGYYMVVLQESGVKAELCATTRAGIHRYTFPQGKPQQVILDLDHSTFRGQAYYSGPGPSCAKSISAPNFPVPSPGICSWTARAQWVMLR